MERPMLFDVEVVRVCSSEPKLTGELTRLDGLGDRNIGRTRGTLGAELQLRDAQSLARALENAGGAALVVPCRYLEPIVSLDDARQIAATRLEELKRAHGDVYGSLEDGREQWMWWRFYAEHLPSQLEGREPGCIYIDVDKLDGHIKSDDDAAEYRRWQEGITRED